MKNTLKLKTIVVMTAAVFTVSTLLTACGGATSDNTSKSAGTLKGTVTVSGSTSVQPLAQDLSDVFSEIVPDITVEIQGGGSSLGIKNVNDGITDIGTSSRDLTDEEKSSMGLTEHIIAYDGITVVVHPSNSISNLSKDQIAKIFKGEIKNWKDIGGPDKEILIVTREEGSGTRTAFEELLGIQEKKDGNTISLMSPDALVADGTGAVKANIASKDNAIGYTSLGFVDDTIKKVSIDNVECTIDTIKSKVYPISRPFLMLTKGDIKPEVKSFLDFILSDKGQEIVGKSYVKLK